ncbi:MAG: hypothetical protein J6C01_04180 [Lachnospiraceae bacterium]|nr:hypothetical protein [Lachnospiraceae bacterium]
MEGTMKRIYCNKCGHEIKFINGIAHEDYVFVSKEWGYFSQKDGKTQEFVLCEGCVEKLEREFAIPAVWKDTTEML